MKKFIAKMGVGLASISLAASSFAPAVFAVADQSMEISGNGEKSINTVMFKSTNNCSITQKNKTGVGVGATIIADSGHNTANGNTNSDVTIDAGKATASLEVTVSGNLNSATDPCCSCDSNPTLDATIKGNGEKSINTEISTTTSNKTVKQKNKTLVGVLATVKAKTGKNKTVSNTGGTVGITSDSATSTIKVNVPGSANTLP